MTAMEPVLEGALAATGTAFLWDGWTWTGRFTALDLLASCTAAFSSAVLVRHPRHFRDFTVVGVLLLAVIVGVVSYSVSPAQTGAAAGAAAIPRYNVVSTDGTNLIVTDNQTNVINFYTIDKEAQIGSELKLRGSADLNDVGKPTIKPKLVK